MTKCFLDILISWYDGLQCRVKWDGHIGTWFSISAGVRQGGVLSPDLYNIYVDGLIYILQSSGIGCHIHGIFAACQCYAEDMCLLAPSIKGLQRLLDLCCKHCSEWDIGLNPKKSKNMCFGAENKSDFRCNQSDMAIEWVS